MATRSLLGPRTYDVATTVTTERGTFAVQLIAPTTRYQARKALARLVRTYPTATVRLNRTIGAA